MMRISLLLVAFASASACASPGGAATPNLELAPRRSLLSPTLSATAQAQKESECRTRETPNVLRVRGGGKPTVLVTGGAGYIGSHCAVALQEAGYEAFSRPPLKGPMTACDTDSCGSADMVGAYSAGHDPRQLLQLMPGEPQARGRDHWDQDPEDVSARNHPRARGNSCRPFTFLCVWWNLAACRSKLCFAGDAASTES